MTQKNTEECKGCNCLSIDLDYNEYYNECGIISHHEKRKCPCLECLLKGICMESCPEFTAYFKYVRKK